jgi:hypothetical protein
MTEIAESRAFAEAAKPSAKEGLGRLRIALLTPGWGSSGYYSADVCEAAGTDRVFTAGTHMYANHPTATENYERPVRDITQLAAVLAEDATWNAETNQLEAEVTTFSAWREPISEMAPHIGVSIRATAEVEEGTAEGREGPIITRIDEALSVDFVTKAGRGGKVLEVLEDAFGAGRAAAQHITQEALTGDVRDRLADMVKEAYRQSGPDVYQYAWVRDYDADAKFVYFDVEGADMVGTFQQTYEVGEDDIPTELTGDPVEVRVATSYVPVAAPSGQSTTTEASKENPMPQIEEARLRALEEAEARKNALETELAAANARAEEAETERNSLRATANTAVAEKVIESAFNAAEITAPKTVARLAASAPLTESGEVDVEKLKEIAAESVAELAESRGDGKVRGLGFGTDNDTEDVSEAEFDKRLAEISGSRTLVKEA